ncbi:MAG TPA: Uma2 family endonuclease [Pyrinomonadaceae bacterium]|nr:Uma2 family endonuclease [Pyrinomonadaceae bacterium]
MSSTFTKLTTADELLAMPDDGYRYELIEGELIRMSPAGARHGRIAVKVVNRLGPYVEKHGLGEVYAAETGFKLRSDPDTVRAPDVAFVSKSRVELVGDPEGYWSGAPDLAVEVQSPNDTRKHIDAKARHWISAGAKLVWVVKPRERTVIVYKSLADIFEVSESGVLDAGEVVPGFKLTVSEIF